MAKLNAPMHSIDASGKLADNLIYQTWRGRPYCRVLRNPRQAPSLRQQGTRHIVAACSRAWSNFSEAYQATWDEWLPKSRLPNFQKFVGYNIDRAGRDLTPVAVFGDTIPQTTPDAGSVYLLSTSTHNALWITPTNQIANPGFEAYTGTQDDGNTDTHTAWGNNQLGSGKNEATAAAYNGQNCLKITTGDNPNISLFKTTPTLSAGDYRLTLYARGDGSHSPDIALYRNSPGGYLIPRTSLNYTSTTWQPYSITFTLAASSSLILFLHGNPTPTARVWFDDVALTSTTAYDPQSAWTTLVYREDAAGPPHTLEQYGVPLITPNIIGSFAADASPFLDPNVPSGSYYNYSLRLIDANGSDYWPVGLL